MLQASRLEMIKAFWEHRLDLEAFRTGEETHQWFRLADRPPVPSDARGVYAYDTVVQPTVPRLDDSDAKRIVDEIAGKAGTWETWQQDGNLVIDMFTWLWHGIDVDGGHESGVGDLIDTELMMYEHHQGKLNGHGNRGWLRVMFFSLTQQIIRQDVDYWRLYVGLRPDRAYTLVSYPYYAKCARGGDPTFFRHIDLNVADYLATNKGANIIQGSVSLDDETVDGGCTELVLGFHRHIKRWWDNVVARGEGGPAGTGGKVQEVHTLYKSADADEFGAFVPVTCSRGQVRISRPELIHGSTTTTANHQGRRATVLPWFVKINTADGSLDVADSGSQASLTLSHATQVPPNLTPSGKPNTYGTPPYRFPASVQLVASSAIGGALVCQRSWVDPVVVMEAREALAASEADINLRVKRWRKASLIAFKGAFQAVKAAEMEAFAGNSFWRQPASD